MMGLAMMVDFASEGSGKGFGYLFNSNASGSEAVCAQTDFSICP